MQGLSRDFTIPAIATFNETVRARAVLYARSCIHLRAVCGRPEARTHVRRPNLDLRTRAVQVCPVCKRIMAMGFFVAKFIAVNATSSSFPLDEDWHEYLVLCPHCRMMRHAPCAPQNVRTLVHSAYGAATERVAQFIAEMGETGGATSISCLERQYQVRGVYMRAHTYTL